MAGITDSLFAILDNRADEISPRMNDLIIDATQQLGEVQFRAVAHRGRHPASKKQAGHFLILEFALEMSAVARHCRHYGRVLTESGCSQIRLFREFQWMLVADTCTGALAPGSRRVRTFQSIKY